MPLPEGLITITVTGTYLDAEGTPRSGEVAFAIPQPLTDITGRVVLVPTTIRAELDANGSFSLTLPVTDDIRLDPPTWTYTITERIDQWSTRTYSARIPQALAPTVDITDLVPMSTPDEATESVLSVDGRTGHVELGDEYVALSDDGKANPAQLPDPLVTQVNGKVGDVTLTSTDVGAIPRTEKNAAGGVASLGDDGKLIAVQDRVLSVDGQTGNVTLTYASDATIDAKIAAHVAAPDPHQDRAYSDTNLTAHSHTTDPHGDRAAAAADLAAHVAADDPHGDRAAAAATYVPLTSRGQADGVASLDSAGLIPIGQIPPLPYDRTYFVASETEMLALTPHLGDIAVRSDTNGTYMLVGSPASSLTSWFLLTTTPPVTSVNGEVGDLVLGASDVGAIPTTARGAANGVASLGPSLLIPTAQIPSLDASKVTGTFGANQIPDLDAAVITTGVFGAIQIPDLDAGKITTGILDFARIPTGTTSTTVAIGDHTHSNYIDVAEIGAANGVASLDADGKIPSTQLSAAVTSVNGHTGDVVLTHADVDAVGTSSVGVANGVAPLDGNGLISPNILPSYVSSVNNGTGDVEITPGSIGAVPTTDVGAANGVASLDATTKIPIAQIPDLSGSYLSAAVIGAPDGVAALDSSGLVPTAQIPALDAAVITTGTLDTARIPDLSASYVAVGQKGAASGVAPLSASTKLATSYLETNVANGVAGLDASGKITSSQALVSSVNTKTGAVVLSATDVSAVSTTGGSNITPPTGAGTAVGTTLYAERITISDPNDVFTQALRIDLPADPSGTTRTAANGSKGTANGAPDTWGTYFNGSPTGYGNEFGELRSNAAKVSTIAFRAKAASGTSDGRKIIDVTDAGGTTQGGLHYGGLVSLRQRSSAAPTDALALPANCQQLYFKTDAMPYVQSSAGERQIATTVELRDAITPSGGTLTVPDVNVATMHSVTLTGNVTTLTLPSAVAGKSMTMALTQDATGGRTIAWPSTVKWPSGTPPTLSGASKTDVVSLMCIDGTTWLAFLAGADMAVPGAPPGGTIVKQNTFEGGTDTTAISTGNSGGASGDAFQFASGSLIKYTATNPIHGTMSLTTGGATVNSSVAWTNVATGHNVVYLRYYIKIDQYPANSVRPVFFDNGSGSGTFWLSVNDTSPGPGGTIAIENGDTSHLGVSATQLALNTVYRIEVKCEITTQTVTVRIYEDTASTALEEFQGTGWSSAASSSRLCFGQGADVSYDFSGHLLLDDVAYAYDGWIGA